MKAREGRYPSGRTSVTGIVKVRMREVAGSREGEGVRD